MSNGSKTAPGTRVGAGKGPLPTLQKAVQRWEHWKRESTKQRGRWERHHADCAKCRTAAPPGAPHRDCLVGGKLAGQAAMTASTRDAYRGLVEALESPQPTLT